MEKIAIIIPYFGKWPEWIDLYLYSCSKNAFIDFHFFTDLPTPRKTYSNTIFHSVSFAEYCKQVSEKLNIHFAPQRPYKLCDLKAFYGQVHQDILTEYGWWGFGDIDMVLGDMSELINERTLSKYDVLTTHVQRIAGHFTIIRKDSPYSSLGFKQRGWQRLLEKQENVGFDERHFTHLVQPFYTRLWVFCWKVLLRLAPCTLNYRFFCDYLWGRLTSRLPGHIYWREFFTTFKPSASSVSTYNLSTGQVYCDDNQIDKIIGGVKSIYTFSSTRRHLIGRRSNTGARPRTSIKFPPTTIFRRAAS